MSDGYSTRSGRPTARPHGWRRRAAAVAALCLASSTGAPAADGADTPSLPPTATAAACPPSAPAGTTCWAGQQRSDAYYLMAVPADWNGALVVHAHGGPDLGEPTPDRVTEDLDRWSVMLEEGYAWAGSSYRRGGYGTRMAAADTEQVRRLFVDTVAEPATTLLHGQSWGGLVAAKTAEVYGERRGPYDGVLLTNGVLAGGTRGYDYRVDLRVVYQYYCRNHPRPSEPSYELWRGLPAGSTLTAAELRRRAQECTGYQSPPEQRTPGQRARLADILAVTRIPERTFYSHLSFATFTFRDIVHERLHDRNPFGNVGVTYRGSTDDRALNRGVLRYRADAGARRDLSFDSDLTGEIHVPVLTLHAIDDPTAFVEHEAAFRLTLEAAGNGRRLVQSFTTETEHSALSDSGYATAIDALHEWVTRGRRPTAATLARDCATHDARHQEGCFFAPGHRPRSYFDRVHPRPGHTRWPAVSAREVAWWERVGGVGIAY